jgi:hypothetical protein
MRIFIIVPPISAGLIADFPIHRADARHARGLVATLDSIETYYHTNCAKIQLKMGGVACCSLCSTSRQTHFLWFLAGKTGH